MLECGDAASSGHRRHAGVDGSSTAESISPGDRVAQKNVGRIAVILKTHVEHGDGKAAGCGVA